MKRILLSIVAGLIVSSAYAKPETQVVVIAQGQRIELTKADVKHIIAVSHNEAVNTVLSKGPQTIRYNEVADVILAIHNSNK
jgi:hypothetical protein